MTASSRIIYALSFAIAGVGFIVPFWPLCVVGVLIAALSGRTVFAIAMALLLDVGSGLGTGLWRYLYVPFTILAIAASLVRAYGAAYFLDKTPLDTL